MRCLLAVLFCLIAVTALPLSSEQKSSEVDKAKDDSVQQPEHIEGDERSPRLKRQYYGYSSYYPNYNYNSYNPNYNYYGYRSNYPNYNYNGYSGYNYNSYSPYYRSGYYYY